MKWFRIVVPDYNGERIEGAWQRDVDYYISTIADVWIKRGVTFTIEFKD